MLKTEFMELTKMELFEFEPTEAEYEQIEKKYYETKENKQDFCKRFVKEGGIDRLVKERALLISKLNEELKKKENQHAMQIANLNKEISDLQKRLDKELEWKPCEGGTNLSEKKYQELLNCPGTEIMDDEKAKKILYEEFGFDPSKIILISEVDTYEANKYHQMRKKDLYKRKSLYNATDWNYIRFNCVRWQYEMINGNLVAYSS